MQRLSSNALGRHEFRTCRLPCRADEQLGRVGVSENIRWRRGDDQSPFHHRGDPKKRLSSVQEAESARYEKKAIRYEKKIRVSVVEPTLNVFQELELENQSA